MAGWEERQSAAPQLKAEGPRSVQNGRRDCERKKLFGRVSAAAVRKRAGERAQIPS